MKNEPETSVVHSHQFRYGPKGQIKPVALPDLLIEGQLWRAPSGVLGETMVDTAVVHGPLRSVCNQCTPKNLDALDDKEKPKTQAHCGGEHSWSRCARTHTHTHAHHVRSRARRQTEFALRVAGVPLQPPKSAHQNRAVPRHHSTMPKPHAVRARMRECTHDNLEEKTMFRTGRGCVGWIHFTRRGTCKGKVTWADPTHLRGNHYYLRSIQEGVAKSKCAPSPPPLPSFVHVCMCGTMVGCGRQLLAFAHTQRARGTQRASALTALAMGAGARGRGGVVAWWRGGVPALCGASSP